MKRHLSITENLIKHISNIYVKLKITTRDLSVGKESTIRSLLGLKKYVIRYRYAISISFFLVVVTNGILLISPKILQTVVDELEHAWRSQYDPTFEGPTFTISQGRILVFALLIFGIAFVAGILRFIQRHTIQGVARQMEYHLRADFFIHLQKTLSPRITITSVPVI